MVKMVEPEKPFACTMPDCGMTFTNEDHLHVHTKKHDMILDGLDQKAAFAADQTPTPTRFIRNCEEVGLFQDLQNVNPFDEGFKRAMEAKCVSHSPECTTPAQAHAASAGTADDVLHTPQMVFPTIDSGDSTLYTTTNNHKNITINRSSSDESGTIKEYETTTISKRTNEVTTISRRVAKQEVTDQITTDDISILKLQESNNKDVVNETSVSYTNNVIKIESNVEIRKNGNLVNIETSEQVVPLTGCIYTVIKDTNVVDKHNTADHHKLQVPEPKMPVMSQKSIDILVDSLAAECETMRQQSVTDKTKMRVMHDEDNVITCEVDPKTVIKSIGRRDTAAKRPQRARARKQSNAEENDVEVVIKFPDGKRVRMTAVKEHAQETLVIEDETKHKLKEVLKEKADKRLHIEQNKQSPMVGGLGFTNVVPISGGTLLPVTLLNPVNTLLVTNNLQKIPIRPMHLTKTHQPTTSYKKTVKRKGVGETHAADKLNKDAKLANNVNSRQKCFDNDVLESRSAASKRYRIRLREKMSKQEDEVKQLKELNAKLVRENMLMRRAVREHLRVCSDGVDLRLAFVERSAH